MQTERITFVGIKEKPRTRLAYVTTLDYTTACFIFDRTANMVHVGTCGAGETFIGLTSEPWGKKEPENEAMNRAWSVIQKNGGAKFVHDFCKDMLGAVPLKEQVKVFGKDYLKALKESCEAFDYDGPRI